MTTPGQAPFPASAIAFTRWAVRRFVPRRAALMVLTAVIAFGLQAFTPFFIGRLVDAVSAVAEGAVAPAEIGWLFAALVLCWLVGPLFQRLYVLVNAYTVPRLRADVINHLFAWTTGHAPQFFHDRFAGALSQRVRQAADGAGALFNEVAVAGYEQSILGGDVAEEYRWARNARLYFTAMRVVLLLLTVGFMTGLTWVALGHAADGALSAGDIAMLLTIGVNLAMVITELGDDVLECFEFVGVLRESLDSVAAPHAIVDRPGAPPLVVKEGAIALEGATYG